MLAARSLVTRSLRRATTAAANASAAPAAAAAAVDPEHAAWLQTVKGYKVTIPRFEWTLEWALPSPVPLHQFEQSPLVIEVTDRHPDADALVYKGPNVVGGYPHPDTGKTVTREEHKKLVASIGSNFLGQHHHE